MGDLGQVQNLQVKVDNWGRYFLQRLHHFYKNNYHCDLTLLFSTLDSIKSVKVHRLVLYACTDYFESLDIMKDSEHGEFLQLSNEMHPDVVIPIISFMYTGKLEFPTTLQSRLYEAASKLRMTVLTKLLDDPPKHNSQPQLSSQTEEYSKINQQQSVEYSSNFDTQDSQDSYVGVHTNSGSFSKQVEEPHVTLTIAKKLPSHKPSLKPDVTVHSRNLASEASINKNKGIYRANILSRNAVPGLVNIPSKPKIVDLSLPPKLPGRKLPIWKRKVPLTGSPVALETAAETRQPLKKLEPPKPTRFEWDEDLSDPTALKDVKQAFDALSYDKNFASEILQPICREEDIITSTRRDSPASTHAAKRTCIINSPDSPPPKRPKESELQEMKEYGKQQQLRNEIICSEDTEDTIDTEDVYSSYNEESDDIMPQMNLSSSSPKPILKTVSKPEPSQIASKRVRFSLEEKENNEKTSEPVPDFTAAKASPSVLTKQKTFIKANELRSGKHAKIVSEMLKKYPNLAMRDNVKFKVVTKNQGAVPPTVQHAVEGDAGSGNKSASSSVSYIYLVNENSNQLPGTLIETVDREKGKDKDFDVDNKNGPWYCTSCSDNGTIEFDSYYSYRKHFVEVHEIKVDARICEYCGVRNSKRNYLLYHLYTKHGIQPPPNVSFPKCSECDYVALSDALLIKHKASHDLKEGLTCHICNVSFKTFTSMQVHLKSEWHNKKVSNVPMIASNYPCPFCDLRFSDAGDLKDHMEAMHHCQRMPDNKEKLNYTCPYCEVLFEDRDSLGKHVILTHWGKGDKIDNQNTDVEMYDLQSGRELQMPYNEESEEMDDPNRIEAPSENQTSSELESLNNVASGIATSLNLVGNEQTVIYYEQQTESQDIGGEATIMSGEEYKEYMIAENACDMQTTTEYHNLDCNEEASNLENEDSNSRTSNTEEVNPTSCSDHDYSEPHAENNVRQIVTQVTGGYVPGPQIVQQILPDQRLVFSTQPNVVFQQSRLHLPQRVLIAPGNVVLSQIAHTGQNVIFPQVISPGGQLILSEPVLGQQGNLIENPNNTVVYTNPEIEDQTGNYQPSEDLTREPEPEHHENQILETENSMQAETDNDTKTLPEDEEEESQASEPTSETTEPMRTEEEENNGGENVEGENVRDENEIEEIKQEEDAEDVLNDKADDPKQVNRLETSKIADDWDADDAPETSGNIESRSDGPTRPDFF